MARGRLGTRESSKSVDAYISAAPKEVQPKLTKVRAAIREVAPAAAESISYRMPFYSYKGQLAWFGLQRAHIGLYLRPPVIEEHRGELAGYETTKSGARVARLSPADSLVVLISSRSLPSSGLSTSMEIEFV